MWIEIEKDIFESADFKGLNYILQLLTWYPTTSVPRYNLFIHYEKLEQLENYIKLSDIDKKIIETEFDAAITSGITNGKYIVTNADTLENTFNIEEAILFLNQPVYIVIENSLNDSYFLNSIFYHFDQKIDGDKRRLVEFVKNNWIQFVNAGGWTNIRNYIKGQLKTYDHLASINQKNNFQYLRCFVMMDSDKEYASQVIQDKEDLKVELERQRINVHILKKRAMENYMPDKVINNLPTSKTSFRKFSSWVAVYNNLTPEQKDYLNYKSGFPKKKVQRLFRKKGKEVEETIHINKERIEQSPQIQALYSLPELSDTDYETIDNGLKLPKFKDYFPTLFENNYLVHKTSLLQREGGTLVDNEFLEILQKIQDLI